MDSNKIIAFPTSQGYQMIDSNDIEYIQSDGNYSKLFLIDTSMIHVNKTISALSKHLCPQNFIRTHHQYLVNKQCTTAYHKKDGQLILCSGKRIPVSVRKRKDTLNFFTIVT